ncbi:type II secretion system F family protein [Roseofilum capinflatum]|uniref:Type II secretion system F family protein n=1 Tax=Roseofilum capinflatum BLCC-M114 TaxID=3022440 RepID=A0ABT7BD16_9CYAN|nr:type II secretion system F family protein [Roseofilum capinflatum]MDJ1176975.1 type II secretion system F family protein [Roseofilum capinflatum BLCC-M114]
MKTQEKVLFFTNLAELLQSGITLRQGLTLAGRESDRHFQCYLQGASRALRNGQDLASALTVRTAAEGKRQTYFDPWTISAIRLAETQGTLVETCLILAEITQTQGKWKTYSQSIRSSTLLALWSLLTLLAGILNANMAALLHPMFWLQSAAIALFLWILAFSLPQYFGPTLVKIGRYLPLVRPFIEAYTLWYLSQLRLPLSCGMPILTALEWVQQQTPHVGIKKELARITRHMRRGQTLSDTLQGIFPPLAIDFLRTGEETGELDFAWQQIGQHYQAELEKGLKFMASSLRLISILALSNLIMIVCIRGMFVLLNATNPVPF